MLSVRIISSILAIELGKSEKVKKFNLSFFSSAKKIIEIVHSNFNRFCEKSQPLSSAKKLITVISVNDNEIKRNDEKEVDTK